MKTIEQLKLAAKVRDGLTRIYKPHGHDTWLDCYEFDGSYHSLVYEHAHNEKSCHMICIDVNGRVLKDE